MVPRAGAITAAALSEKLLIPLYFSIVSRVVSSENISLEPISKVLDSMLMNTVITNNVGINHLVVKGRSNMAYSTTVSKSQENNRCLRFAFSTSTPKNGVTISAGRLESEKNTPVYGHP